MSEQSISLADILNDSPAKIRPMGDRILVRKCRMPDADDGVGAIVLPETARDTTNIGLVMTIGPKVKHFTTGECLQNLEFDPELGPVYIQAPGGRLGISQYVQKNPLRSEGDEFFIHEKGLLPFCKFISDARSNISA